MLLALPHNNHAFVQISGLDTEPVAAAAAPTHGCISSYGVKNLLLRWNPRHRYADQATTTRLRHAP